MNLLKIKPLSINDAWKGKRYRTDQYDVFIQEVLYTLKPMEIPKGKLECILVWGLSSKSGDTDNPIKPFVDCLQKYYGFDDKVIKRFVVECHNVKKGQEFIGWELLPFTGYSQGLPQ